MDAALLARLIATPRASWELAFPAYSDEYFSFCNAFAHLAATGYLDGTLTFEVADKAMNELFSYSYADEDRGMPVFALHVFNAFDQGEFHHPNDSPDVDPEQKYTNAILAEAMAQYAAVDG